MKQDTKEKSKKYLGVKLLQTFSEKELNDFEQFILCSYFNKDERIVDLFKVLRKSILRASLFTTELQLLLYAKVFDDEILNGQLSHNQQLLLNAKMNILMRLAKQYLITEALKNNSTYQSDLINEELLKRQQYFLYLREYKKTAKRLDKTDKDKSYYEHKKKISQKHFEYLQQSGLLSKTNNLDELQYYIDVQYLSEKLSYYITQLTLSNKYGKLFNNSLIQTTEHLMQLPVYANHPLLSVEWATISLIQTPSKNAYTKLLQMIDKHETSIAKEDLIGIYIVVSNFLVQAIRKGQFSHQDLFQLYTVMDEKDCLLQDNFMQAASLRSYVIGACRTNAFEKALQIVEKYRRFIRKPIRESVYHFNLGVVAFYKKNFDLALHHFIRVDINFNIQCRIMMLKSHYELDKEYDERTLQIYRSAERFFNEHKSLSRTRKTAYKNFTRTLINVYRIKHQATKMTLDKVKTKLEGQELNSDKSWLLEKIGELE